MAKEITRGVTTTAKSDKNGITGTKMVLGGSNDGVKDGPGKEQFLGFHDPKSGEFHLRTFLYNSKKKTILGRTVKRWGICLLCYTCFYAWLAIFWGVMLFAHLTLIFKHEGPWIAPQDVPFFGPGLSYVPPLVLIDVQQDANKSIEYLNEFLKGYQKLNAAEYKDCGVTPSSPENCFFDVTTLGDCAPGGIFGYWEQKPCIILKFNRAYGMKFDPYSKSDDLPNFMPADLKDFIKESKQSANKLWLSCEGFREKDKESLSEISYWPDRGFENHFYPFLGHSKHISPLIAIKVSAKKRGVSIMISCQVWAKNLSTDEKHGSNALIILKFE